MAVENITLPGLTSLTNQTQTTENEDNVSNEKSNTVYFLEIFL